MRSRLGLRVEGDPGCPLPEPAFPSPGPRPGLVGAPGGQTVSLTHCVPRMAVRAWLGPGLQGGGPKRTKGSGGRSQPQTAPAVATPWLPQSPGPGAPLPSKLLSPHPPATASSPGTGTQPWGVRALTILGLGDEGQPGLRSSATGMATSSATRTAGRLARPDGHF